MIVARRHVRLYRKRRHAMPISSLPGSLFALLAQLAGPLLPGLRRQPADRELQRAERVGDVRPSSASCAPPPVAEALATDQLAHLTADPPLRWEQTGWRCAGRTRVSITTLGAVERSYDYPTGTFIPVAAGIIHLPPCSE
jgi:hypothetical protein